MSKFKQYLESVQEEKYQYNEFVDFKRIGKKVGDAVNTVKSVFSKQKTAVEQPIADTFPTSDDEKIFLNTWQTFKETLRKKVGDVNHSREVLKKQFPLNFEEKEKFLDSGGNLILFIEKTENKIKDKKIFDAFIKNINNASKVIPNSNKLEKIGNWS